MSFALSLATLGNVQRAIELTREALATDPLRAAWYNQLARYSTTLNRLDEAERALHQAMELQPTVTSHYELLTVIEIQRGDAQAGLAAAQRVAPGARQDVALASARQIGPDRGAADAALKTLIQKYAGDAAVQIADVYALRNDAKATFDWLDRGPGATGIRASVSSTSTLSSCATRTTRASPHPAARSDCRSQGRVPLAGLSDSVLRLTTTPLEGGTGRRSRLCSCCTPPGTRRPSEILPQLLLHPSSRRLRFTHCEPNAWVIWAPITVPQPNSSETT